MNATERAAREKANRTDEYFAGLYESGANLEDIAAAFGCSRTRVQQRIARVRPSWRQGEGRERTANPSALMAALRRPEVSHWSALHKACGMGPGVLQTLVSEMGLWQVVQRLFRMRRRRDSARAAAAKRVRMLEQVRSCVDTYGAPLSAHHMMRNHPRLYSYIYGEFGSIGEARRAAGISAEYADMRGRSNGRRGSATVEAS